MRVYVKKHLYVVLFALLGFVYSAPLHAVEHPQTQQPEEMWIDLSLQPQLVDGFNRLARPDDIARVDHISRLETLTGIQKGRRLVIFKSVVDAQELLPRIGDRFDIIGYNLEHGPSNRPAEQADPVGSVIRMRRLADQYDKELALGPDRNFAVSDGVAMAPFVDLFILQVQRVQTEPQTVREFVVPLARQYRSVNPDIEISVQIRTEGDVMALRELIESLGGEIDGISILTSPETIDVARDLLEELRPEVIPVDPTAEPGTEPVEPDPKPGTAPGSSPPEKATPNPAPALGEKEVQNAATRAPAGAADAEQVPAGEPSVGSDWALAGSLVTIGILGGGLLIAGVVYAFQNLFSR